MMILYGLSFFFGASLVFMKGTILYNDSYLHFLVTFGKLCYKVIKSYWEEFTIHHALQTCTQNV